MWIIDAHLDLAYNALHFGRDVRRPVADIRAAEAETPCPNGVAVVAIPELLRAGVGILFGSLFAMPASRRRTTHASPVVYNDRLPWPQRQAGAHASAMRQLDYYHRLADEDERVILVQSWGDVEQVQATHGSNHPRLGIVPSMEGADPIRDPAEIELWYERGVRMVGPAWDDTRYAPGQWQAGGRLPQDGRRLLERMADLGLAVDLTHMAEAAALETLESYAGPVIATHCNARALTPTPRHLSDTLIRRLAEREGVIGVVLYNVFLRPDHAPGEAKERVTGDHVVAHIDHICQLTGTAAYVGLGSDWDGGFGAADIPAGFDTIADLPRVADLLVARGYTPADIQAIMGGNWSRVLRATLPG